MKANVTEEQRACILVDLAAGRPYREMMAEYGLSWYVISQIGRRAGLEPRGPGIRPPEIVLEAGQVFNRWTVLKPEIPNVKPRKALCRCECGTIRAVLIPVLARGESKSCGCWKLKEATIRMAEQAKTHGLSRHPLYARWCGMMERCGDPRHPLYHRYGGRGITVHESLQTPAGYIAYIESLEVRAGLIGNTEAIPGPDLTDEQRELVRRKLKIDRENNDGNYEPGNLRWATDKEQSENSDAILFKPISR